MKTVLEAQLKQRVKSTESLYVVHNSCVQLCINLHGCKVQFWCPRASAIVMMMQMHLLRERSGLKPPAFAGDKYLDKARVIEKALFDKAESWDEYMLCVLNTSASIRNQALCRE